MAGKSNKLKNRRASNANSKTSSSVNTEQIASSEAQSNLSSVESSDVVVVVVAKNGVAPTNATEEDAIAVKLEAETAEVTATTEAANESKQGEGDVRLYPISVKVQSGNELELQLNPGDSIMDLRQFLLDAPETCYYTCYELMLHTKDGSIHQLADYNEILEVADIITSSCSLQMIPAFYDDRSIRAHIHHVRELFSLYVVHASLSTSLALQQETVKTDAPEFDGLGFMTPLILVTEAAVPGFIMQMSFISVAVLQIAVVL